MAASSSTSSVNIIDTSSQSSLKIKPNTSSVPKDSLKVLIEQVIDFNALARNGIQVARFFSAQKLNPFFQIHHGPTYVELVKQFWVKAEIFDEEASDLELSKLLSKDKSGKKTRTDFGLKEFEETEIRSNVMGLDVKITQSMIAKVTKAPNAGMYLKGTSATSEWAKEIFLELHDGRGSDKVKAMALEHRVLYKIILASILPREGATDQMSWDHKHLMTFLVKNLPVNLPEYIFNHLCQCLRETQSKKQRTIVPYGRLISEMLHQGKLIQKLESIGVASDEELGTQYGKVMSGMILFYMNAGFKKIDIVRTQEDIEFRREASQYLDDFPPISKEDNIEVIANYVKQHFLETGQRIDVSMLPETADGKWKPSKRRVVVSKTKPSEEEAEEAATDIVKSLQASEAKKRKSTTIKTTLKRARQVVFSKEAEEEEEEEDKEPLRTRRRKVVASESAQQAESTARLAEDLQKLPEEESQKHLRRVMEVKQEAGAKAASVSAKEGLPTPVSNPETVILDSPSPDDDQPISKTFNIPKPTTSKPVSPIRTHSPYGDTDLEKQKWGRTLRIPPVSTVKPSDPNYHNPKPLFDSSSKSSPPKTSPSVIQNLETHLGGELPKDFPSETISSTQTQTEATSTSPIKVASESQQQTTSTPPQAEPSIAAPTTETASETSPPKPVSEAIPASEDKPEPESETIPDPIPETANQSSGDVIMTDASEDQALPDSDPQPMSDFADEMPDSPEAANQIGATNQGSEQTVSPEHPEFTDTPASSSNPSQPPTLHLTPDLQKQCMAIFSDLQELIKMKDLIVLPPTFNHLWESLHLKMDIALDNIQEMVMDSHVRAAKQWFDDIAASMTELKLRTDINRQIRSTEFYPQEPEPEPQPAFQVRAPWVEELLRQTAQPSDPELKSELEIQKQKHEKLAAKVDAMAADQKIMKDNQVELLQNQTEIKSKMDIMMELLLKMQKP